MNIKTNILLLRYLTEQKLLTRYCYFIKLKYRYSNSLYYKFSFNHIGKTHKHAHATVKRQIDFFLSRGWCRLHNNHLVFISKEEMYKVEGLKANSFVTIDTDINNIKQLKLHFQHLLMENKLSQQEWVIAKRDDLDNPKRFRDYKTALKWLRGRKTPIGESLPTLTMSLAAMANTFNLSMTSANRVKRQFILKGWYGFLKRIIPIATGITQFGYNKGICPYVPGGNVFLFKGTLYRSQPSLVCRFDDSRGIVRRCHPKGLTSQ